MLGSNNSILWRHHQNGYCKHTSVLHTWVRSAISNSYQATLHSPTKGVHASSWRRMHCPPILPHSHLQPAAYCKCCWPRSPPNPPTPDRCYQKLAVSAFLQTCWPSTASWPGRTGRLNRRAGVCPCSGRGAAPLRHRWHPPPPWTLSHQLGLSLMPWHQSLRVPLESVVGVAVLMLQCFERVTAALCMERAC
eukprot:336847-Pelagomonas_calceolata.AAC.4